MDKNDNKANCQVIKEAKHTLLRKQAEQILWPRTIVPSQEQGSSLQQWNKSKRKDQGGKCCLCCQRTASLSNSERFLQNRTQFSQPRYLKGTPTFPVLMTTPWDTRKLHGSLLKLSSLLSLSLQCVPARSYIYDATTYLHCVWSQPHTLLPTGIFCPQ